MTNESVNCVQTVRCAHVCPLNTCSINGSRYMNKYSLVHHLTFEPRTPGSSALTLAVQHVAATTDKEQEKRQTSTPTPGRADSHHTLRGPLGAANSRFHLVAGGTNNVRACLCFAAATTLFEKISKRRCNRIQHQQLRAFPGQTKIRAPGVHRCHCRQAPRLWLPSTGVQNSADSGERRRRRKGVASQRQTFPH